MEGFDYYVFPMTFDNQLKVFLQRYKKMYFNI